MVSDVIIIGAGLSGIGAAYHLQEKCPDRSYTILEGRSRLGGTWDKFRYPGIRSDSDMYTMGYEFKPWLAPNAISDGPSILAYVQETADENAITPNIRFNHRMTAARWSSSERTWTVEVALTDDDGKPNGETTSVTGKFLYMCAGYYSYEAGFRPDFPGEETFDGPIIHPQDWPEDLDYSGKKVAVIGSGATAMTLIPAMVDDAEHVTMIQRSPTYIVSRPARDPFATFMRKWLPEKLAYKIVRAKNIRMQGIVYRRTRTEPDKVRAHLLNLAREELGPDVDVDTHFTPTYNPWDQRLCLVPDGDLFSAIRSGEASVVTDTIQGIEPEGVRMASGELVEADIIVSATGLQLVTLGDAEFSIDGETVDFSKTWTYKGMSYSDIPNMVSVFGYINASWTLRADMIADYVCRLLNHMKKTGNDVMVARLRPSDSDMNPRPWVDDFSAGYMQRTMDKLPRQGDREPWLNTQSYQKDLTLIAKADIADDVIEFSSDADHRADASV